MHPLRGVLLPQAQVRGHKAPLFIDTSVGYTPGWRIDANFAQKVQDTVYRRGAIRSDFWLADAAAFPPRTHRFGGKEEGETNHAERWSGTVRARVSRRVRRSYSPSKRVERHLEAVHLFIATHNLRIKHSTSA